MTDSRAMGVPEGRVPFMLAPERLSVLQASAHYHARRVTSRGIDPSADVADIRQSLLLTALSRIDQFDASQASWATYANLLLKHAAWDYTRSRFQRLKHAGGSLDDPTIAGVTSDRGRSEATDPAFADAERALDLGRAIEGLPDHLRRLCRLLEVYPPSIAQRRSGLSQAEFYRQINEIRMRFRAFGLWTS